MVGTYKLAPMAVDYVYRIDQPHERGQLAQVCSKISEEDALIGDIVTINIGRHRSIREISVEVVDHPTAESIAAKLDTLGDVHVISFYDRAIAAHEGGKLRVGGVHAMETPAGHARRLHARRGAGLHGDLRGPGARLAADDDRPAPWRSARTAPGCSGSATSARSPRCR